MPLYGCVLPWPGQASSPRSFEVPKGTPQRSAAYHRRDKVMLTASPFAAIPIPKLLKINSGKPWHG